MLVSTFRGLGGRRASSSSTIFASVGASISHHHATRGCWGASTNNKGGVARRRCCRTFIGSQYSSRGRRTNASYHQSLGANNNKPSFLSTLQIMHQLRGGGDDIVSSRTTSSFTTNATTNNTDYEQSCSSSSSSSSSSWRRVYLAVGSNLGDRYQNIAIALSKLQQTQRNNNSIVRVITTSYLRMTSPMYVTDQPSFLNGAVLIETTLSPLELLSLIKQVESDLGRNITNGPNNDSNSTAEQQQRYGPRPVDLDILLYDGYEVINPNDGTAADTLDENHVVPNSLVLTITDKLEVPHPRMSEREFVLEPMCDLERIMMKKKEKYGRLGNTGGGGIVHPIFNKTMSELLNSLLHQNNTNHATTTTTTTSKEDEQAVRVLPLPRNRMLTFNRTLIMGILNVTPDSFSDGGSAYSNSSELAALHALQLVRDGADIIDVGGESTRPGANEMDVQIEMDRVIPVIKRIRQICPDVPISIATRHSTVAKAAIMAGADIVNDVSGGTHDGDMLSCVASLGVPMIIMHMRGNPRTMQSLTNYSSSSSSDNNGRDDDDDDGVVSGVARELMQRSTAAELAGIPRWLQVVDPGIGFAKDMNGNLSLLRSVDALRQSCDNLPLLFGPSRKGFIGNITGETNPKERDYGTIAACLASIQRSKNDCGGNTCNVLRVHNVKAVKQAVLVYEAIQNTSR